MCFWQFWTIFEHQNDKCSRASRALTRLFSIFNGLSFLYFRFTVMAHFAAHFRQYFSLKLQNVSWCWQRVSIFQFQHTTCVPHVISQPNSISVKYTFLESDTTTKFGMESRPFQKVYMWAQKLWTKTWQKIVAKRKGECPESYWAFKHLDKLSSAWASSLGEIHPNSGIVGYFKGQSA